LRNGPRVIGVRVQAEKRVKVMAASGQKRLKCEVLKSEKVSRRRKRVEE